MTSSKKKPPSASAPSDASRKTAHNPSHEGPHRASHEAPSHKAPHAAHEAPSHKASHAAHEAPSHKASHAAPSHKASPATADGSHKASRVAAPSPEQALEDAVRALSERYPDGLTASQIVVALIDHGLHLTEATFRKWVQLGLLPRSRRVGKPGKHQGSHGLYPHASIPRIAAIKRRMAEGITVDDIARSVRLEESIDGIGRALDELFRGLEERIEGPGLDDEGRRASHKQLLQVREQAGELLRRIGLLERRVVAPQEREAKARAFGSGTSGGAGDLL